MVELREKSTRRVFLQKRNLLGCQKTNKQTNKQTPKAKCLPAVHAPDNDRALPLHRPRHCANWNKSMACINSQRLMKFVTNHHDIYIS